MADDATVWLPCTTEFREAVQILDQDYHNFSTVRWSEPLPVPASSAGGRQAGPLTKGRKNYEGGFIGYDATSPSCIRGSRHHEWFASFLPLDIDQQ